MEVVKSDSDSKEAFNVALRDLENQQTMCVNKGKFLDNVVMGRETVTFDVIQRCRESAMQLKQASYVFHQLHKRHVGNPQADAVKFAKMLVDNEATVVKVDADLAVILSWVPQGTDG